MTEQANKAIDSDKNSRASHDYSLCVIAYVFKTYGFIGFFSNPEPLNPEPLNL